MFSGFLIKITISSDKSTIFSFHLCSKKTNHMKTINYLILGALLIFTSCNSNNPSAPKETTKKKEKTQSVKEAFETVHKATGSSIQDKLQQKIKTVKDGDSRKAIIVKFEGEGLKNQSSLSSDNEVEIRTKGNKNQITLVTKSNFNERKTRFVLEFDKGNDTGTFEVKGMSMYIETYKKDGATYENTSAESWVKGTVELSENNDNKLKGTASLNIPKLNFNKNGANESTSKDVKVELGFYNANL